MARGFYVMHRGWMDNAIFPAEPYTRREAFLWLIERAAWDDSVHSVGRRRVPVERGQLAVATRYLAAAWQWGNGKVQRFLETLKSGAMIETQIGADYTLITICNYRHYQDVGAEDGAPPGTQDGARPGRERGKYKDNKLNKINQDSETRAREAGDAAAAGCAAPAASQTPVASSSPAASSTRAGCPSPGGAARPAGNASPSGGGQSSAAMPATGDGDREARKDFVAWMDEFLAAPKPYALTFLSDWLGKGASLDLVRAVIVDLVGRKRAAQPDWYPGSLKYFNDEVLRRLESPAAYLRASNDNRGASAAVDLVHAQWRQRVSSFKANGFWVDIWGDKPDRRDCGAPLSVLREFGYR